MQPTTTTTTTTTTTKSEREQIADRVEREIKAAPKAGQKSIWRAYLCWMIGGLFGLHHFYLRRDRQAFLCWTTFGKY